MPAAISAAVWSLVRPRSAGRPPARRPVAPTSFKIGSSACRPHFFRNTHPGGVTEERWQFRAQERLIGGQPTYEPRRSPAQCGRNRPEFVFSTAWANIPEEIVIRRRSRAQRAREVFDSAAGDTSGIFRGRLVIWSVQSDKPLHLLSSGGRDPETVGRFIPGHAPAGKQSPLPGSLNVAEASGRHVWRFETHHLSLRKHTGTRGHGAEPRAERRAEPRAVTMNDFVSAQAAGLRPGRPGMPSRHQMKAITATTKTARITVSKGWSEWRMSTQFAPSTVPA